VTLDAVHPDHPEGLDAPALGVPRQVEQAQRALPVVDVDEALQQLERGLQLARLQPEDLVDLRRPLQPAVHGVPHPDPESGQLLGGLEPGQGAAQGRRLAFAFGDVDDSPPGPDDAAAATTDLHPRLDQALAVRAGDPEGVGVAGPTGELAGQR
jgi:hypothetical protein